MTIRDEFTTVEDGDQLDDGYFNGIAKAIINSPKAIYLSLLESIDNANTPNYSRMNACAEKFTDSNGYRNTIDNTNSTKWYDETNEYYQIPVSDDASNDTTHNPNSVTNPDNFFDHNNSSYATKTGSNNTTVLGKTFPAKTISDIKIKADGSASAGPDGGNIQVTIKLQTYDGSNWNDEATLINATANYNHSESIHPTYENVYHLNSNVQGLRISIYVHSQNAGYANFYTLEYGTEFESSAIVETNTICTTKTNRDGCIVFFDQDDVANTEIVIDEISFDGGSTWTLTGLNSPEGQYIDFDSNTDNDIAFKIKLKTNDTSVTPKLYGFGVCFNEL